MKVQSKQTKKTLPMSVYQHRYWSKWALNPQSTAFNTSLAFEISGDIDREALKQACYAITEKHDVAHATFSEDGSRQYYSDFSIDDFYCELEHSGPATETVLASVLKRPFDLAHGPPAKFYLIVCGEKKYYFVATAHHIIADAAAAKIFLFDIIVAYSTFSNKLPGPLHKTYSYADCIQALHASQTIEKQKAARDFWEAFLAAVPVTVDFPLKENAVDDDYSSETIYFELSGGTTSALKRLSQENRTTLFTVLSALYGCLLSKYARQEVVVFSYPINMRPPGFGHVAGCFVNLALQKVVVGPSQTFKILIDRLTQQRKDAKPHLFYQIGNITRNMGTDIEKSYFNVFFGETYLNNKPLSLGSAHVRALDIPWSQEFDRELRLLYDEQDVDNIKFRMDFRRKKFDRNLMLSFVQDFQRLSGWVAEGQDRLLSGFPIIGRS